MRKKCKICKIEKPIADFYKNDTLSDGHFNFCKSCMKRSAKKWRDEHPNHVKAHRQLRRACEKLGREILPTIAENYAALIKQYGSYKTALAYCESNEGFPEEILRAYYEIFVNQ